MSGVRRYRHYLLGQLDVDENNHCIINDAVSAEIANTGKYRKLVIYDTDPENNTELIYHLLLLRCNIFQRFKREYPSNWEDYITIWFFMNLYSKMKDKTRCRTSFIGYLKDFCESNTELKYDDLRQIYTQKPKRYTLRTDLEQLDSCTIFYMLTVCREEAIENMSLSEYLQTQNMCFTEYKRKITRQSEIDQKQKFKMQFIKHSHELLTVCGGNKRKYEEIKKIVFNSIGITFPSSDIAERIINELGQDQIIQDETNSNSIKTYISTTLQNDPTTTQYYLGSTETINQQTFRSSSAFGIYFNHNTPWDQHPSSIESISDDIFDRINVQLPCLEGLQVAMRVFECNQEVYNNQNHREVEHIQMGQRLECRIGCKDHVAAKMLFELIKKKSVIKCKYKEYVKMYPPLMYYKTKSFIAKDPLKHLIAHSKEILDSVTKQAQQLTEPIFLKAYIVTHFDSIFKRHAITPFDSMSYIISV